MSPETTLTLEILDQIETWYQAIRHNHRCRTRGLRLDGGGYGSKGKGSGQGCADWIGPGPLPQPGEGYGSGDGDGCGAWWGKSGCYGSSSGTGAHSKGDFGPGSWRSWKIPSHPTLSTGGVETQP